MNSKKLLISLAMPTLVLVSTLQFAVAEEQPSGCSVEQKLEIQSKLAEAKKESFVFREKASQVLPKLAADQMVWLKKMQEKFSDDLFSPDAKVRFQEYVTRYKAIEAEAKRKFRVSEPQALLDKFDKKMQWDLDQDISYQDTSPFDLFFRSTLKRQLNEGMRIRVDNGWLYSRSADELPFFYENSAAPRIQVKGGKVILFAKGFFKMDQNESGSIVTGLTHGIDLFSGELVPVEMYKNGEPTDIDPADILNHKLAELLSEAEEDYENQQADILSEYPLECRVALTLDEVSATKTASKTPEFTTIEESDETKAILAPTKSATVADPDAGVVRTATAAALSEGEVQK
ncbi:MAG: hypothetical protein AB1540_11230 [Bdellovibrionota bacterium]